MVVLGWQLDLMILKVFCNLWFYDHLSLQTSSVSLQDSASARQKPGGVLVKKTVREGTPPAPGHHSLSLCAASALRAELSLLAQEPPVSWIHSTGPAPHPQSSPGNPLAPQTSPTARPLPCRLLLGAAGPSLHIKAICITLFQLKSVGKSGWHLAGNEREAPARLGVRRRTQPNKALLPQPRGCFLELPEVSVTWMLQHWLGWQKAPERRLRWTGIGMRRMSFSALFSHLQTSGLQCPGLLRHGLDSSIFKYARYFCSADADRVRYTGTEITPRLDLSCTWGKPDKNFSFAVQC